MVTDPRSRRTFAAQASARDAAARLTASVEEMRAGQLQHGPADADPDEAPRPLLDEPPTGLLDLAALRAALGADPGGEVNPASAAWLAGDDPCDECGHYPEDHPHVDCSEPSSMAPGLAPLAEDQAGEPGHTHPYFVEGCAECVERAEQLEAEADRHAAAAYERLMESTGVGGGASPEPEPEPEPVAPVPPPAVLPPPQAAPEPVRAFIPERPTPLGWRPRHDPRSRQFGVRRQFTGSVPVHDVLLPVPAPPLNQGAEGSCVGAAVVQAANVLALLADRPAGLTMTEAETAYRWAQRNDAVPGEDYVGTDVNAGMKAGRAAGWWPSYSWLFGTRDIAQTVMRRRPVVVGIPWLDGMAETGPGGLVDVAGADAGIGHCLVIVGIRLTGPGGQPGPHFGWLNSYGPNYGDHGIGWIPHRDLTKLLHGGGEAATPDVGVAA